MRANVTGADQADQVAFPKVASSQGLVADRNPSVNDN